jgi:integrase
MNDLAMILMAYRHGLRVSELCALTWDQIDFSHGLTHVRHLKNGIPSVHHSVVRRCGRSERLSGQTAPAGTCS